MARKKKNIRLGLKVAAGMFDVFAAAGAGLAIVILLLMLSSLFTWLHQDLTMTFADLTDNITDAVFIKDGALSQ